MAQFQCWVDVQRVQACLIRAARHAQLYYLSVTLLRFHQYNSAHCQVCHSPVYKTISHTHMHKHVHLHTHCSLGVHPNYIRGLNETQRPYLHLVLKCDMFPVKGKHVLMQCVSVHRTALRSVRTH